MGLKGLNKHHAARVLGIDASTNSVAFCLYTDQPEKWGEIMFHGATVWERIADANRKVSAIADELECDLIVIEAATFVQSQKTVILLAYVFGSIVSSLIREGVTVESVPPISWQNFIGNKSLTKGEKFAISKEFPDKSKSWYQNKYREIRKQRTIDWVKDTFDIEVESDNVSDAIGIGYYAREKMTH